MTDIQNRDDHQYEMPSQGACGIYQPSPGIIGICSGGKTIATIYQDGTFKIAEDSNYGEAALAFWCAVASLNPGKRTAVELAAPDMLAALEQIVRYADRSTDPAIVTVARAAISKAKGR